MICFLKSKLMTIKKSVGVPFSLFVSFLFSFGCLLILLTFFSEHVHAKFNCFKTVAVDSVLCCAGFRIRWKMN